MHDVTGVSERIAHGHSCGVYLRVLVVMVWWLAWRRALVTASNCVSSFLIAGQPLRRKIKNALNTLVLVEIGTSLYEEISLSYKVKVVNKRRSIEELKEIDVVSGSTTSLELRWPDKLA